MLCLNVEVKIVHISVRFEVYGEVSVPIQAKKSEQLDAALAAFRGLAIAEAVFVAKSISFHEGRIAENEFDMDKNLVNVDAMREDIEKNRAIYSLRGNVQWVAKEARTAHEEKKQQEEPLTGVGSDPPKRRGRPPSLKTSGAPSGNTSEGSTPAQTPVLQEPPTEGKLSQS